MSSLRSRSKDHSPSNPSGKTTISSQPAHSTHWLDLRLFNLPFLPILAACLLLLTTALGTTYSFSLYSSDDPTRPIHQLTRIPLSSLVSTHNTHPSIPSITLPYFANKSNFLNQTFVKIGWAWTSLAVWAHLILLASHRANYQQNVHDAKSENATKNDNPQVRPAEEEPNPIPRSMTLYATATALWIFLTQWFFGSSLIDRLLILTGAECVPSMFHASDGEAKLEIASTKLSNAYCERRWGQRLPGLDAFTIATHRPYWSGGIDISGHAFLLSFSILIILSTVSPSLRHLLSSKPMSPSHRMSVYANLALVAIWWWMLLMTSLYFHGPVEKAAGLIVGLGAWWVSETMVARLTSS